METTPRLVKLLFKVLGQIVKKFDYFDNKSAYSEYL